MMEGFLPAGWDLSRIDACCALEPGEIGGRQGWWHTDFELIPCATGSARLHPLTIEQNALTSFRSRTTLVPAFANTIGPGFFLKADRIIGGADSIFDRGMQWQGTSLWMTLRYGPDPCVPSSFMPTFGGRLFYHKDLAGPLVPELN